MPRITPLVNVLHILVAALSATTCIGLDAFKAGSGARLRLSLSQARSRSTGLEADALAGGHAAAPHRRIEVDDASQRSHRPDEEEKGDSPFLEDEEEEEEDSEPRMESMMVATDDPNVGTDDDNITHRLRVVSERLAYPDSSFILDSHRDDCTGCDFTVDLRCDGTRIHRNAAFHRIHDCVVPMYGMIELARMARMKNGGRVCALTWRDDSYGMDIQELLHTVVGFPWHALVAEDDACVADLHYHAAWRSWHMGATQGYLDNFGKDPNLLRGYSINIQANLGWLHRDVSTFVGDAAPGIIIINRFNESRSFKQQDFLLLKEATQNTLWVEGRPLIQATYRGNEQLLATVKKFTNAAVVVGYHGAAWANTLFTARKHCMHQITTWEDLEEKKRWRVNWQVEENKLGQLNVYTVPLQRMLDINDVSLADYANVSDKDHFIKDLPWVALNKTDIDTLMLDVRSCLNHWVKGRP